MHLNKKVILICIIIIFIYVSLILSHFKPADISFAVNHDVKIDSHFIQVIGVDDFNSTKINHLEITTSKEETVLPKKIPEEKEKRNPVVYSENGLIDTTKTRIDFFKETWYEEFLVIREALGKFNGTSEEFINERIKSLDGFSEAELTYSYAVIKNACMQRPFGSIMVFEKTKGAIKARSMKELKMKDFYYSNLISYAKALNTDEVSQTDDHTLLLHPRQYSNIFHVLEGTSIILFIAIHPELFPNIKHIIVAQQPSFPEDSWAKVVEQLYLNVFPESKKPSYGVDDSIKRICDRALVVAKAWEPQGTGSFIGEFLAADLFRAVVYKYINWHFQPPSDKLLKSLFIKRVTKRKILNSDAIHQALVANFTNDIHIEYRVLDQENAVSQMKLFSELDIVIAAHGAGLTNIIFMTPSSYLYELFPPFWQFACYKRLAFNMDIQYAKSTAVGEKGPECNRNEKSTLCQYNGIRDRDFTMDIDVVLKAVNKAIVAVRTKKYPSIHFDLCVCYLINSNLLLNRMAIIL